MKSRTVGNWKKAMAIAGICLLTAGTLCACGEDAAGNGSGSQIAETGSDMEEASAGDLKPVTMLLDWTPNTNHTGIYVAKELGYYEEAGLDVSIELPYDGTATQLVGAGKGDFGISNAEDVLYALSLDDPMPVVSVATIIQHNTSGFVSLKEDGIQSPADWAGKTYGGYGGTIEQQIVKTIAENNGVDPESINFVDLGNSDTLTSLKNEIDFTWVFEAAELINLDLQDVEYTYLPVRDYGDAFDYYTPVLAANTKAISDDPEMARAFVKATAKGYQYAIENPEDAAEILLKAEPDLDENLVKDGQAYLAERYAKDAPQWGYQKEEVWKQYEEYLFENGLLGNELDISTVFTNEYLPEV
ncbi:MAG: ABC transporter substrate-binding protein [Eubacterium sp.]|nr:ABC transporter substrate-binding protein [Eubacterium sp.]